MITDILRGLEANILVLARALLRGRGLWLRGLLCWSIGLAMLFAGSTSNYDGRFQLRGVQNPSKDIVLIQISQDEWIRFNGQKHNWIRPLKEIAQLTDSFYWNASLWSEILKRILSQQPKVIGVTFFFGDNIRRPLSHVLQAPEFTDDRLIWAANLDSEGRPLLPVFAKVFFQNAGLVEIKSDGDGIIRQFSSPLAQIPHMALRLASTFSGASTSDQDLYSGQLRAINFQGPRNSFTQYSLTELFSGEIPPQALKGKIVIIGGQDSDGSIHRTPVGEMTRAELMANLVDNTLGNKWIGQLNPFISALFILGLLILSVWIISSYPQSVALVFYFWIGIFVIALSIWIFDTFYFWTPVLAPLVQLVVTYIVFLSFQLAQKDNLNWRLEQERHYLLEVEQLKNNFVSLISHDLKTPIAKIQAICDRILAENPNVEIAGDLSHLRRESSELHRYIQSILQITRIESRDIKINKDAADINEIIFKVVEQLRPLAEQKNITIETQLEPMFLIELDSVLIQEVILNLTENAIKYTPEGGTITVRSREVDDRVYFEVEDTGLGIPEEDQKRIFEKFVRAGDKEAVKGSGLGLYLVKYFIELHGGQIFLKSQQGKGTRIGFSLPMSEELDTHEPTGDLKWTASSRF